MVARGPTIYLLIFWFSFLDYSTIKRHTNIDELLFKSLSEQVASSNDFYIAEETLNNRFHFDDFRGNAITLILERVEAKSFEREFQNALSRFNLPINTNKAIQIAKYVTKSEHIHTDLVFDIGETGRFIYCRTLIVKQDNDNEIDVLVAIYEIQFRLSVIRTVEIKERMPLLQFFLGDSKELRYEEQSLSFEDQQLMKTYFGKLAVLGLLRGYYQSSVNEGIDSGYCQTGEKSIRIKSKHLYVRTSTTNFLYCIMARKRGNILLTY